MNCKTIILKGTIVLTVANITARIMGFFFRIYLSRAFLPSQIGVYQLLLPLYTFIAILSCGGVKTASVQLISSSDGSSEYPDPYSILKTALSYTLLLSFLCILVMHNYAEFFSKLIYGNPTQANLIRLITLALPFAAAHNCVCGCSIALGNFRISVFSQILEQAVRIFTILILKSGAIVPSDIFSVEILIFGMIFSEMCSCGYSIRAFQKYFSAPFSGKSRKCTSIFCPLIRLAVPLTFNQILPSMFHTVEASAIPFMLRCHGYTMAESLGIYGIITGIALPCIVFPSAVTQSLSTTLLPAVSSLHSRSRSDRIVRLIRKVFILCISFGLFFNCIFFIMGKFIGNVIFENELSGIFIRTLSFICPFLYVNTCLISCLNGLGKPFYTLKCTLLAVLIRLLFIYLFVPSHGISGYLWGLLAGQIFTTVYSMIMINTTLSVTS